MLSPNQEKRIVELENYDVETEENITLPPNSTGQVFTCVRRLLTHLNSKFSSGYTPDATIGCNELKTSASLSWYIDESHHQRSTMITVWINQLYRDSDDYTINIHKLSTPDTADSTFETYNSSTLDQACNRIRSFLN